MVRSVICHQLVNDLVAEQDYEGSGRASKGASNGGGAYRPPPSRRGMSGAMTDESSGEDRNDRKRSRPKANSLAVRMHADQG